MSASSEKQQQTEPEAIAQKPHRPVREQWLKRRAEMQKKLQPPQIGGGIGYVFVLLLYYSLE